MKQSLTIYFMLFVFTVSHSQNDFQNQFYEFRQEAREQYTAYNDSINKLFIKYLGENWIKFHVNSPIPTPKKPLPQMDISKSEEKPQKSIGLPVDSIIRQKDSIEDFNVWNLRNQNKENARKVKILFYGADLQFHFYPDFSFSINSNDEKTIANVWKQLSSSPYEELINELLFYRNDMNLNDWGMYQLLNSITNNLFPEKTDNQIIFSTFIMNQLGYRMKIGKSDNRLVSLIAFQSAVYEMPFIHFENEKYYVFGNTNTQNGVYSYSMNIPNTDKHINLQAKRPFRLALSLHSKRCNIQDKTYSININKNLIDLFQTYPQTDIIVYANTPISNITRKSLEKELLPDIANKTEKESVDYLLHFVQTAFAYKNDLEQFNREKFFFTEELFYYPFSDCEDRSVLFSQLVRRFLGLQVILLDYPDHVTTAVKFNDSVPGDFIDIQGDRYVICDPTYLHAKAGQSIPRYRKQKAKIYILD